MQCVYPYVHITTISEERGMNLKASKERCRGGLGGGKGKGEMTYYDLKKIKEIYFLE